MRHTLQRPWCLPLAMGAGASFAQTRLRAWSIHPENYPVTEATKSVADEVDRATKGKYQMAVFSRAALGDHPKAVQMLTSGEVAADR